MTSLKRLSGGCVAISFGMIGLLSSGCADTAAKPTTAPKAAGASVVAAKPAAAKPAAQPASGPTPVHYDIGQCFAYRYSTNDRCSANNDLDCQKAVSDSDCGVPNNFVYTNSWCQVNDSTFYKYHVICQGYLNTGPQPQPQCPNDHVAGTWILSGPKAGCDLGSCTERCAGYCTGGYCTGGGYTLCYWGYAPSCDCGTVNCPCTGPDCDAAAKKKPPFYN